VLPKLLNSHRSVRFTVCHAAEYIAFHLPDQP